MSYTKKNTTNDNPYYIDDYFQFYLDLTDIIDMQFEPEEATKMKETFDLQVIISSICINMSTMVNNESKHRVRYRH